MLEPLHKLSPFISERQVSTMQKHIVYNEKTSFLVTLKGVTFEAILFLVEEWYWQCNYTHAQQRFKLLNYTMLSILCEWQPRNHCAPSFPKVCTCSKYSQELQVMQYWYESFSSDFIVCYSIHLHVRLSSVHAPECIFTPIVHFVVSWMIPGRTKLAQIVLHQWYQSA